MSEKDNNKPKMFEGKDGHGTDNSNYGLESIANSIEYLAEIVWAIYQDYKK